MSRGRLLTGTSGFAYKQWKPGFYPADLKGADMLRYYSQHLPTVEINNTFYRTPKPELLSAWKEQTSERFVFTLKAPRRITHIQRLRDTGEAVAYFLESAKELGTQLGCVLFQCPPNLPYRPQVLEAFLEVLPRDRDRRFAMEFRHSSWEVAAVQNRLAEREIAWCAVDDGERREEVVRTASGFVYLRLRRPEYSDDALRAWADRLRPVLEDGADAYVYFKHEDDPSGVRYARRLLELLATGSPVAP